MPGLWVILVSCPALPFFLVKIHQILLSVTVYVSSSLQSEIGFQKFSSQLSTNRGKWSGFSWIKFQLFSLPISYILNGSAPASRELKKEPRKEVPLNWDSGVLGVSRGDDHLRNEASKSVTCHFYIHLFWWETIFLFYFQDKLIWKLWFWSWSDANNENIHVPGIGFSIT